jgi:phospholipid/cholesterol/gamma-HCH transport system substrate-binding protein
LDESKKTFARLQTFAKKTNPLITDLRPAGRDLAPTLRDVHGLAPDLRRFFVNLDPLIKVSKAGLPALKDTLTGLKPLLGELSPFLEQLNPPLRWLEYYQGQTAEFITNGAGALEDTVGTLTDQEVGHYLRQAGPGGAESVAMWPQRLPTNRGNAYLSPVFSQTQRALDYLIFPNFDCDNTTYEGRNAKGEFESPGKDTGDGPGEPGLDPGPGCFVESPGAGYPGAREQFKHVDPDDNTP